MSMFKNQENKKDYNDSIFILIDVGKEKCTVMSTVYQDRNVKIHKNQYYSKDGLRRGMKHLIKRRNIHKKDAINIDKLVFDALLSYDKKYGTKFKNKYLLAVSAEKKLSTETKQEYEQRCVENRNSILVANNIEIEYDTTNIENPSKLIKNKKLKYASKFIKQYIDNEKNTRGKYLKSKKSFFSELIKRTRKPAIGKSLEDIVKTYNEDVHKQENISKETIGYENTDKSLNSAKTIQNDDEIETVNSLIDNINEQKVSIVEAQQKEDDVYKKDETLGGLIQIIKKSNIKSNEPSEEETKKIKDMKITTSDKRNVEEETLTDMITRINNNKKQEKADETRKNISNDSQSKEEIQTSIEKQSELEMLSEEEKQMLEEISKSLYEKRENLFTKFTQKISNIADIVKYKVNSVVEERKNKKMAVRDKEQDNYEIKQTNNNKKLGYIGQAGILVGLSVFLGLSHHVPTSTNTNKQIEVNRDKENAKENNDKENNLKGIIQVEDDGIEAGDIVGYDQKEDSQQDYNEQSGQDNDKSNSDKQDSDKESNKKEKDTEEYKSNVITAKEILSTITPGTNLKELTKGTFYASSDKEGPVGSFEKHKKEDKMIEIIKVSFENGKYKIIGVDDNINLYQLKKKYPKANFSCHIKGLGWVNARTVIDAKMKELKKEKNNNKKMVNKGQVVESTNSER